MQNIKQLKSNSKSMILAQIFSFRLGVVLIGLAVICSCTDFVEVELPNSQINGETVFENTETATAAMVYIYGELRDNALTHGGSGSLSVALGHYADELDLYSLQLRDLELYYRNAIVSNNLLTSNLWSKSYNLVYTSNSVIEGLNNSISIPQSEKNQLLGEALFARAFIHFYLVNLFGDVPYIKTTNYQENNKASKLPVTEVYEQIILDLIEAKELLTNTYINSERIRPNRSTVTALLARVYLYIEDWEKAELESTSVINNTTLYTLEQNLSEVFLKESTSTIWQLKPTTTGSINNVNITSFFVFEQGPPTQTALTNTIINAFETGDQRLINWVGSATDAGMTDTWYYAYKYKAESGTSSSTEYYTLFRLAEQYLIRSEARAQQGNIPGAQADLNIIRTRAGLANTTAATTNDMLNAILQERQVELFTEFGHRFFDLKRMGKANAVLSLVKPGWQSKNVLLPIPESELLINENLLPQNTGY